MPQKFSAELVAKILKDCASRYKRVEVHAGLEEGAITADDPRTERTIPEIASYALFNEYGTDKIPSRPFMRNAVNARSKAWSNTFISALASGASVEEAGTETGLMMREDLRASIEGQFGGYVPNAESTRQAKLKPSTLGDDVVGDFIGEPLRDTGAMHRSIGYKVITNPKDESE